jgi:hypothetical protein
MYPLESDRRDLQFQEWASAARHSQETAQRSQEAAQRSQEAAQRSQVDTQREVISRFDLLEAAALECQRQGDEDRFRQQSLNRSIVANLLAQSAAVDTLTAQVTVAKRGLPGDEPATRPATTSAWNCKS